MDRQTWQDAADQITEDEGVPRKGPHANDYCWAYKDSKGIPTIGHGYNIGTFDHKQRLAQFGYTDKQVAEIVNGERPIKPDEVDTLFEESMAQAEAAAKRLAPNFESLPPEAQKVLLNMSFNMGESKLAGFKKMLAAVQERDFREAAAQMQDSAWYDQVGARADRLHELMLQAAASEEAKESSDQAPSGQFSFPSNSQPLLPRNDRPACSNDPVGAGDYIVALGECISSIAYSNGLFWETLWNHPDNAPVREARVDPNALLAGDRLTVPERCRKDENCATTHKHRFQLRGVPAKLRLRFLEGDEPRSNERYRLFIDAAPIFGSLDKNGALEVEIPPDAREARLVLGDDPTEHRICLGAIDPISTWRGIAGRLNNLGFDAGDGEDGMSDELRAALLRFQEMHDLDQTAVADDATREKLKEVHGG